MKKISFSLLPLLFWLLPSATAQDPSPTSTSSQWFAGLKYENRSFLAAHRSYQPGLVVGFNFRPKLALQAGFTVAGNYENTFPLQSDLGFVTTGSFHHFTHFKTGVYLPVHLRYVFSKPHRRFQTYGLAGAHIAFQPSEYFRVTYQSGQLVNQEGPFKSNRVGFKPNAGVGMRARVVDQLFLHVEKKVHYQRLYPSQSFMSKLPSQNTIGLQYNFR